MRTPSYRMTTARAFTDDEHPVPLWIGDIRLLDLLAEGGMGRVFRALDTRACRMVAVKLPRSGNEAEVTSLRREVTVLRQVRHPGIVRVLADGMWDGRPWAAFELLEGRTLLEQIERGRARRSDVAPDFGAHAETVIQIAAALDHLHERGFVHRDVKPANVFLRASPNRPERVTLLDFGLACVRGGGGGRDGLYVGTMEYAAPEQIAGDPVDARADVYSLGCVLYELCAGSRPFEGDSPHEVAQMHLHCTPVAPSVHGVRLPPAVDALILEMLAKSPSARPASAGAAAARFARAAPIA